VLGLWSNFGAPLQLAFAVAAVTACAVVVLRIRAWRGATPWTAIARVGLAGSVLVVLLATALPRAWPPEGRGDLVLAPGRGGLADWRVVLEAPGSLAAVLLVLNVVLYLPVGLFGGLLVPDRPGRAVAGAVGLSILVETWQLAVIGRVASTDDVLLNVVGAVVGLGLARTLVHRGGPGNLRSSDTGPGRSDRGTLGGSRW
jgi:hypothetical protein